MTTTRRLTGRDRLAGALLGTAVGDALGLPYEGLSRRRAQRLFGEPDRHRFLLGHGMVSDDTEHTCMVAQALIACGGDVVAFARALARSLRWWLLGLPAGSGLATARATLRLWCGVPPTRSGVCSAGNGPSMRSAILGAAIADLAMLRRFVAASTRITHTDPRAEHGALAVALAAQLAARGEPDGRAFLALLDEHLASAGELRPLLLQAVASASRGEDTMAFAGQLGLERGVSGFVLHTVPVAIHAWLRQPTDFRAAVMAVIRCGGDTDTTAAIVGGIVGAGVGVDGIPRAWLAGLWEPQRSEAWLQRLATQLHEAVSSGRSLVPPRLSPLFLLPRNVAFLTVVLVHGLRRLLPPY